MMTKELHQKLEKYEPIFKTAIDSNYYRAMDSRFAAEFINACKELNVYINTSCPQCVLRALQTVGKLFFNYKEEPEKPDNQLKIEFSEQSELPDYLPPTIPDNKPIKQEKKVHQSESKQPKKPVTTRSKTNKK